MEKEKKNKKGKKIIIIISSIIICIALLVTGIYFLGKHFYYQELEIYYKEVLFKGHVRVSASDAIEKVEIAVKNNVLSVDGLEDYYNGNICKKEGELNCLYFEKTFVQEENGDFQTMIKFYYNSDGYTIKTEDGGTKLDFIALDNMILDVDNYDFDSNQNLLLVAIDESEGK